MKGIRKFFGLVKKHTPFIAVLRDRFGTSILSKTQKFLEAYTHWVYACVNVIAEEVGSMELKLMRGNLHDDEEDEEVFEHEAMAILHCPNPLMTGAELFQITSSHLDLDGNAFWYIARDESGVPREIYPLRPDRVRWTLDEAENLLIDQFIFRSSAVGEISLKPEEIIWFKDFNPLGDYPFPSRGMGKVEAASSTIDTDNFSRDWNRNFFENSARPDGIIKYEGDLDREEKARLKAEWMTEHAGVDKSNRIALLGDGLEYEAVAINQKDMDFIEQRRFTRDEILAMFRVPKTILGITEDVNRANAEASNFVFALRVLKPRFEKIVQMLNEFYLPLFKADEDLFIEFVSPVPEDRTAIVAEYGVALNTYLTRNEIRRREGLPDTENGDTFFAPFSEVPVDSVRVEPDSEREREERKPKVKDKENIRRIKRKFTKIKKEKDTSPDEDTITRYVNMWKKQLDLHEEDFKRHISKYYGEIKENVFATLDSELAGLEEKEFKLKDVELFFDEKSFDATLTELVLAPIYRGYGLASADMALLLLSTQKSKKQIKKPRKVPEAQIVDVVDLDTAEFTDFLKERSQFFAGRTNAEVRAELFEQIQEAFDKDESLDKIKERVEDALGRRAENFRTSTVARTEVAALDNFVNEQAYAQSGIKKHRWELVDGSEDRACLSVAKQVRKIGEKFSNGVLRPPVHPNCDCVTVPVK